MPAPRSPAANERLRSLALKTSADGRQVVRAESNEPFFWLGDTAWETFHRLDEKEVILYIDNRASKGFNVVMMVVMAEHGGLDFPSREGHYPFLPAPQSTADNYIPDVTRINAKYFDFVDFCVDEAAKRGILVMLVPTWGRYFNYGYYPDGPIIFDEESIKPLGEFLGKRYPFNPFILGGDSNRYWSQHLITLLRKCVRGQEDPAKLRDLPVEDCGAITESLAAALLEGSKPALDGTNCVPFFTYHPASCWMFNTPPAASSAFFPESDWLSLDVVQSGHIDGRGNQGDANMMNSWRATSSYKAIRWMYEQRDKNSKPRPVMDQEPHYESTHVGFDLTQPLWKAANIRNGAYQGVFAGACGYTYGVNSIWQMHNGKSKTHPPIAPPTTAQNNWFDELDLPGSFHVSYLHGLITSLHSFASRVPDQSFIVSPTHEDDSDPNLGAGAGEKLVSGLRSALNHWALVYTPFGEIVEIKQSVLEGGKLGKAEWFDPRTAERSAATVEEGGATWRFVPPSSGSNEDDWVLILSAYE